MNVDINKPIEVQTEAFIKAFGYKDTDDIYCRCFYERPDKDTKNEPPQNLAAKMRAFNGLQGTLKLRNEAGYGIFFVVNGDGQNDAEVKHARAQFIEIDDKPFNEQLDIIGKFPIEPSIIVKTRKSLHTYWILKDGDIKRFRGIQERLISYFNSDISIKNASRVMRLPNFKHNKQEPVDVTVIKFDPALTYTQDEIEAVLPAIAPAATTKTSTETNTSIADYIADAGGRHNAIMQIGGKIRHSIPADMLAPIIRGINNTFAEPLDERELNKYINDLQHYNAIDTDEDTIDTSDEAKAIYEAESAADLADLDALIDYTGNTPAISTGFTELDRFIDDGLKNGLYVLGAISSLGKSTFCLQIADFIARQGRDVIYYSLEMSKAEIQAKSLSRESLAAALSMTGSSRTAKSTNHIMNGRHAKEYTDDERRTICKAREIYKTYAGRIHIKTGRHTVKDIEADIQKHKALTGRTPVLFVDYLQLLKTPETRRNLTDKQITDENVEALKNLSHDLPIICISSFNRESYTEPVTLSAFKESGIIEYTSDILIGLQYNGMDYETTETEKDGKTKRTRETKEAHAARVAELLEAQERIAAEGKAQVIQCKILKNRYGEKSRKGFTIKFYPIFNYFESDVQIPFISDEENDKPHIEQVALNV